MRIISGKYKGRRISPPKNLPVRPTTDMSKEALFNVLNNHFHFSELKVLDLFSGTGNISYEFGSRGCEDITSVDGDFGCVKFIKQTASEFDFNIHAIKSDVYKYLDSCNQQFDVIFADPPYGLDQQSFEKIIKTVFDRNLIREEGMLIIEHSKYTKLEKLEHLSFQKSYGGSFFSFFELNAEETEEVSDDFDSDEG